MRPYDNVYPIERIISAASYLTAGMAGFIWMIIAMIIKKRLTQFLLYHVSQSIFLSIAFFLLMKIYELLFIVIVRIPIINRLIIAFDSFVNGSLQIFYGMSLLQVCTTSIMIYLAVTSFMGMYSYFPWVSNIINANIGRR